MASPHPLAPNVTTVFFTPTSSHPAHPAHIAATTLQDPRPLASDDDYADQPEDDDDSGGISITSADLHEYTSATSMADTSMTELDVAEQQQQQQQQQPAMAESPSVAHPATASASASASDPSYHIPSMQPPMLHLFTSHTSSSDPVLEPLPPIHQTHLTIEDNGCFMPITSFFHRMSPAKPTVPGLDLIELPHSITRDQLQGDGLDPQGINWLVRNVTRSQIRAKRAEWEAGQLSPSSHQSREKTSRIPNSDSFFRFKRMNTNHKAIFPHFQLRNIIAATSRNDIYYANAHRVLHTDAEGTLPETTIDFSSRLSAHGSITTIAATDNLLIAGAFEGEYAITDLTSTQEASSTFGRTSDLTLDTRSRIVNHMHLYPSRSTYTPQAVLCSNDYHLRVLDCTTNQFTHSYLYPAAVNCSATSPNGRMRVVVGDFKETLIINAETGQPFEILSSHNEDAFACAWADDGIHVATAAQDSTIAIWDARNWSKPLQTLASQLSIPRSLRFSPVGSGPRVLIAAEADDYINVINAQTFDSKQVFDFFGPIAGVTFTPDGQSLFVANSENRFHGIIELERTGWAERTAHHTCHQDAEWDDVVTDWAHDDGLSQHHRAVAGDVSRRRRCVDFGNLVV